jgi:predicted transcriptional regulator
MGYILVVDGNKPAGIMSEQEVLMRIVARHVDYKSSVGNFVSRDPKTLTEKHRIADAVRLMSETGDHNVPIVDEAGNAVGVLRTLDIIHFLAEAFPAQVLNLPPEPHQVMAQPEGG